MKAGGNTGLDCKTARGILRQQYTAPEHRNEPVQPIPQKLPTMRKKWRWVLRCITIPVYRRMHHFMRSLPCVECGGRRWQKTSIGVGGAVGPINAPTVFNSYLTLSSSGMVVRQHCRIRLVTAVEPD